MPPPHFQLPSVVVASGGTDSINIDVEQQINAVSPPSSPSTIVAPSARDGEAHRISSNAIDTAASVVSTTSIEHGNKMVSGNLSTSSDSSGFGDGVSPACNDLPACFGAKVPGPTRSTSQQQQQSSSGIFKEGDGGAEDASLLCEGPHTHSNTSFDPRNRASWSSSPPTRYIVVSAEGAPSTISPLRCASPNSQLPCFTANIPSQHTIHNPIHNVHHPVGTSNHHSSSTATANGSEAGIRFLLRKSALTSSTATVSGSTPASVLVNNHTGGSVEPTSPPHIAENPSPESCVPSPAPMDGIVDDDDIDELMPMLARCLSPNPHSPTAIPHTNFSNSVDDFGPKLTGMHMNGDGDSPASIPVSSRHFQSFLSFPHVSSKASSTTSSAAPEFSQLLSKFAERGHYGGSPSPRTSGLQHTSPNLMRYTFSEGVMSRRNSIPPTTTSNNNNNTTNTNHIYHPHPTNQDGVKRGRAKGVPPTESRRCIPGDNAFLSAAAVHHTVRGPLSLFSGTNNHNHNDTSTTLSESTPAEAEVKLPAFQQCPAQKMRVTTTLHRFAATTPTFYSSESAKITSFYASGANGNPVRGRLPTATTKMEGLGFGTTVCSSHNPGSPRELNTPQSPPRPPFVLGSSVVSSPHKQAGVQGSGEGSGYSIMIDGVVHHLPMDIRLPDATTRSSSDSMSTHVANLSLHDGSDLTGTTHTTTCDTTLSMTGTGATPQSQQHMEGWGHHAFATSASTPLQSILDSNPSSSRSPASRVNVDAGFGRRLGLQVPAGLFQALAKANGTSGGGNNATTGSTSSAFGGGTAGSPSLSGYTPPLYPQDGGGLGHNNEARCSIFSSHPSGSRHSIPSDGRATEDLRQSGGDDDWGSGSQEMAHDGGGGLRTLFAIPQHHSIPPLSPPVSVRRAFVTRGVDDDNSPLTKYGSMPTRGAGGGSGWSVSSSTEASARDPASSSTIVPPVSTIPTPSVQGGGSTTSDRWGNSGSGGNAFLDFSLHNSLHRSLANQPNLTTKGSSSSPPAPHHLGEAVSMIPKPLPLSRPVHLDISPRGRGTAGGGDTMLEDSSSAGGHPMNSLFTVVSSLTPPSCDVHNINHNSNHNSNNTNNNNQTSARGETVTASPNAGAAARPRGVLPAMSTANPGRPLHTYNTGRFGGAPGSMHLSGSIGPNFFNAPSNPNNNSSTGFNGSLPVFAGLSGRHPDSSRSTKSSTAKK